MKWKLAACALLVMFVFASPADAAIQGKYKLVVQNSTVQCDTDPIFNCPDPYLKVRVNEGPWHRTRWIRGQCPGSQPHLNREIIYCAGLVPQSFDWEGWDKDLFFDDRMTKGGVSANAITPGTCGSSYDCWDVEVCVDSWTYGVNCQNQTYVDRSLPEEVQGGQVVVVTLNLHVNETTTPGSVGIAEILPPGFEYIEGSANPPVTSAQLVEEPTTDSDSGVDGEADENDAPLENWELEWNIPPPGGGGNVTISYQVRVPSEANSEGMFGAELSEDSGDWFVAFSDANESTMTVVPTIPTLSTWGLLAFVVLLGSAASYLLLRRRQKARPAC